MDISDPKRPARDRDEDTKSTQPGEKADQSFTPPHGDPERAHLAAESGMGAEHHSTGLLSELDDGGVRFEPKGPETPSSPPELEDGPKRGIDPPTSPPKLDEPKDPQSRPETETADEKAMDQADEAGSALLNHDKILKRPKD